MYNKYTQKKHYIYTDSEDSCENMYIFGKRDEDTQKKYDKYHTSDGQFNKEHLILDLYEYLSSGILYCRNENNKITINMKNPVNNTNIRIFYYDNNLKISQH